MVVQNLAVQRGQWLSFLCCYVVCELEKTICLLPRLKFILNSIKNVHVPMKPQRVISATRGWEYLAKDYLWTVFQEFCYETHRFIEKRWESAKIYFFEKPNKNLSFFRSACQSTLLKHAGDVFLVLRNADFWSSKMPWNSLRKSFAHKSFMQRANNASWLISYFDVLL